MTPWSEEPAEVEQETWDTASPVAVPLSAPRSSELSPESYVLGCCLLDEGTTLDRCIAANLSSTDFTSPSFGLIYSTLRDMRTTGDPIDLSTLADRLGPMLPDVGGIMALVQLSDPIAIGTTTRASSYIQRILQDSANRRAVQQAKSLIERANSGQDVAELSQTGVQVGRRSLFDFNLIPDGHESILLGERYLNRGDGAVLVSTSGMGKSSAAIQMATELSLNMGPFGIQGNGPLRSLIMQSEDSDGDVAEVAYSMKHVLNLTPDQIATVNDRVCVVTDRVNRGIRFITHLKKHIAEFKPDLVFINPLQAFMDGDVTESKDLGAFLREGLNGLNEPASFGYIIVHHTTKPAKPQAGSRSANWNEVMYDMAGGAEIINWARAIISLRAAPVEGDFNMVLAKRGRRAGVTRKVPQGTGWTIEPVTTIPLRHATGRIEIPGIKRGLPLIYWEGREPDEKPGSTPGIKGRGRPEAYAFNDFRNVLPPKSSPGAPYNEILRAVTNENGGIPKSVLGNVLKRWTNNGDMELIQAESQVTRYRKAL